MQLRYFALCPTPKRDFTIPIQGGGIMDKQKAKRKLDHAVGRAKRQVEQLTDDAKNHLADAAEQVKNQAEHAWGKLKDAALDAKEKVTGGK